ncbi:hypothetical protein DICVIV_04956 [Dictyocaulus viviparus]|uniref:RRM domain-containing protein n=1 Tax=Dictyocaulus viviparus TaxID=29172 RepID=A0A0D8XYK5_DICVI|nr:hypothetical protein DICVIV_04956 [Dictyocaulus viviparus]
MISNLFLLMGRKTKLLPSNEGLKPTANNATGDKMEYEKTECGETLCVRTGFKMDTELMVFVFCLYYQLCNYNIGCILHAYRRIQKFRDVLILSESVAIMSKNRKRKSSNKSKSVEYQKCATSGEIEHINKKPATKSYEIFRDYEVDEKKSTANNKNDVQTTNEILKQPQDKYVVGSLSSLFGGIPISDSAKDSDIVFNEGESVIKPKKKRRNIDDAANLKKAESRVEMAHQKNCRLQQRMNRKRAHEKRMSLDEKKRTLFVGNAPLSMNERSCKKLFSQYGEIESVRMRNVIPSKETITKRIAHLSHLFHENQSSVIFYVKFKDEASVEKALAYNGTVLDQHRIRVDTCLSKAEYNKKHTVFIGNIPLNTKEDELADFFEEAVGDVDFVRCVRDHSTGMGKGFAFVIFKSPDSVQMALSMTGSLFHKRELRVMKVMKKSKIMKLRSIGKRSHAELELTKAQSNKINQYKFSTRKPQSDKRPRLTKSARKAIQKKKAACIKSIMK